MFLEKKGGKFFVIGGKIITRGKKVAGNISREKNGGEKMAEIF